MTRVCLECGKEYEDIADAILNGVGCGPYKTESGGD